MAAEPGMMDGLPHPPRPRDVDAGVNGDEEPFRQAGKITWCFGHLYCKTCLSAVGWLIIDISDEAVAPSGRKSTMQFTAGHLHCQDSRNIMHVLYYEAH